MSCFQGLFLCPEAVSLLLHNFCIYHISPPGHEVCKTDCLDTVHSFLCICCLLTLCWVPSFPQEFLQFGAAPVCSNDPSPSVEDLADQILEVLNFFR